MAASAAKKTKPTLEDYIFDMESRPPDSSSASGDTDLWTQLQQKEADLVLAAELGKALLEKNEELVKQQEKIVEEYSNKLEVRVLDRAIHPLCGLFSFVFLLQIHGSRRKNLRSLSCNPI